MTRNLDALPVQPAKSRLLIILIVDTSSSMAQGNAIGQLNDALQAWRTELIRDPVVARSGEIAMITFGNRQVQVVDLADHTDGTPEQPFVPVSAFNPPTLFAGGVTPMVDAIERSFDIVATRKQELRKQGLPLANRPLVYLITDGVPTDNQGQRSDSWRAIAPMIREHEAGKHLLFFAIGVQGAEVEVLKALSPDAYYYLDSIAFSQVLRLVSSSIEVIAKDKTSRDLPAEAIKTNINERLNQMMRVKAFLNEGIT